MLYETDIKLIGGNYVGSINRYSSHRYLITKYIKYLLITEV